MVKLGSQIDVIPRWFVLINNPTWAGLLVAGDTVNIEDCSVFALWQWQHSNEWRHGEVLEPSSRGLLEMVSQHSIFLEELRRTMNMSG
jgi:hypothetical protein